VFKAGKKTGKAKKTPLQRDEPEERHQTGAFGNLRGDSRTKKNGEDR